VVFIVVVSYIVVHHCLSGLKHKRLVFKMCTKAKECSAQGQ